MQKAVVAWFKILFQYLNEDEWQKPQTEQASRVPASFYAVTWRSADASSHKTYHSVSTTSQESEP